LWKRKDIPVIKKVMSILELSSKITQKKDRAVKRLIHDVMVVKDVDDEEEDEAE
jgi:hypothetical protein